MCSFFFFFQAEDGIRDGHVTGVQTCALPICQQPDAQQREPAFASVGAHDARLRPGGPGSPGRMNGEELAEGVYGFETHGVVNWYLVEDGDRLTAIDAGLSSSWDEFTGWIKKKKRRISDLEAVVLTHAHVDHFGFAARARKEAG